MRETKKIEPSPFYSRKKDTYVGKFKIDILFELD